MKNPRLKILAMLFLLSGVMALGQGRALALNAYDKSNSDSQLYVDDDRVQCPQAQFQSIQAAVLAARPNDKIYVCPGIYREQVRIDKPLTVQGISVDNQNQAIVMPVGVAPNSTSLATNNPIAAIILVDGASKVTLQNLTVDGATNGITGCAPNLVGVYYRNSSGSIDSLAVRNIKLGTGLEGCQSGLAIFVQSGQGGSSKVSILNNSVHDYQKNGITANEAGTDVMISGNAVSGIGSTPNIAQNGIQIADGATGTIDSNSIINHIYSPCVSIENCGAASANILIIDSDGVKVTKNNAGKAQLNIYYQGNKGDVSNNIIFDSDVFDGIDLVGDMNRAISNNIFNSDAAAIYVLGNKNIANANNINEAPIGILEDSPSSGNNYNGNKFFNTGVNVVTASPSISSSTATTRDALNTQGGTTSQRLMHPAMP
jgi:hypothetical protein